MMGTVEEEMICSILRVLSRAKLLFVLGRLSVELPTNTIAKHQTEAAEIIGEIDEVFLKLTLLCQH